MSPSPAPSPASPPPNRRLASPRPRASSLALATALGAALLAAPAHAADWPTYAADNARSNTSPDLLPTLLAETWTWSSQHPPQPAWQGEAKWDGWNKVYNLKPRQTFDRAFHPVIVGNHVLFGSSADDKLYCLDATTGRERWTFYADGPIRLAPTATPDRVWFGSDDGLVYCLETTTGKPLWQTRIGPADRRIPGNGRVISAWPVRTSVLVRDGVAYATAGMFPSEGIHLVALDANSGNIRWRQIQSDLPAQGYLLASSSRLYVPAGRDNPVVCDLASGQRVRVVEGAGGTYALLAGDSLVFGPGKTGQLGWVDDGASDQLATFQGHHMIVTTNRSFLQTDTEITALDRTRYNTLAQERKRLGSEQSRLTRELRKLGDRPDKSADRDRLRRQLADLGPRIDATSEAMQNCILWKASTRAATSLILAGNTLVAGGLNQIIGFDTASGTTSWTLPVRGEAYGLAASNQRLYAATDQGVLHTFAPPSQRASLAPAQPRP